MQYPMNMRPPSTIGTILAASNISGLTVLGELPDRVAEWMVLPECVTKVQADNQIMFHWAQHSGQKQNDLRADTATYQRVGMSARAVVTNPYAVMRGSKPRGYQIIGMVKPPSPRYPDIQYFRLLLKYIPSSQSASGTPEIWAVTYIAHSQYSIKRYLGKAEIVGI